MSPAIIVILKHYIYKPQNLIRQRTKTQQISLFYNINCWNNWSCHERTFRAKVLISTQKQRRGRETAGINANTCTWMWAWNIELGITSVSSLFTLLAWLVCLYFIGLPWTRACVCSLLQGSHSFLVKSSVECSECELTDQNDTVYFSLTLQQLEAANWHLATFDELSQWKALWEHWATIKCSDVR